VADLMMAASVSEGGSETIRTGIALALKFSQAKGLTQVNSVPDGGGSLTLVLVFGCRNGE